MIIFQSFKKVSKIIPKEFKFKSIFLIVLVFMNTVLEIIGLGALIPVLGLILKDDFLENEYVKKIDIVFSFSSEYNLLIFLCSAVITIIIIKNLISFFIKQFQAKFSFKLYEYLVKNALKINYEKKTPIISNQNSNQLVWQINSVPSHFVNFIVLPLVNILNETLVLAIIFTSIILFDYRVLIILSLVIGPIMYLYYFFMRKKIEVNQKHLDGMVPKLLGSTQQFIFGYMDVKISTNFSFFYKKYSTILKDKSSLSVVNMGYRIIPPMILETLIIIGAIILIIYGKMNVSNPAYLLNLFGMFAIAAYKLVPSVNQISASLTSLRGYNYVFDYFNSNEESFNDVKSLDKLELDSFKQLQMKDFSFGYTYNNIILKNINLTINKGDQIGIIGKSGSGKSTLMNCFLGFYDNYQGSIHINGYNTDILKKDSWLSQVGYVSQNVFFIEGSIKDNITFGISEEEIDYDKLYEVIEKSSLNNYIKSLNEGVESAIGELGSNLSGGQKQRIGIARALYFDAKVLFLDEATSALDNETESEIIETLSLLSKIGDITTIIIAHRYTALKSCNIIYEINEGSLSKGFKYSNLIDNKT